MTEVHGGRRAASRFDNDADCGIQSSGDEAAARRTAKLREIDEYSAGATVSSSRRGPAEAPRTSLPAGLADGHARSADAPAAPARRRGARGRILAKPTRWPEDERTLATALHGVSPPPPQRVPGRKPGPAKGSGGGGGRGEKRRTRRAQGQR